VKKKYSKYKSLRSEKNLFHFFFPTYLYRRTFNNAWDCVAWSLFVFDATNKCEIKLSDGWILDKSGLDELLLIN
jgi:hypothetical protein